MFDDLSVDEFVSINAVPAWGSGKDVEKDDPDMYSVNMGRITPRSIEFIYVGEYKLDGTKKTYEAACDNFKEICDHLLLNGWIKDEQFKNFEWY